MKYKIISNELELSKKYHEMISKKLINHEHDDINFQYLFIIGGDGTFLRESQKYIHKDIHIISINSGTLGFFSWTNDPNNLSIEDILNEKNYNNLDYLTVVNNGEKYFCLNDFAIHSNYTMELSIYINDIFLQKINSNGILVNTPFGSTARNKSMGGPILFPSSNTIALNEVESINNKFYNSLGSSIILNNKSKIKISYNSYKESLFLVDGKEFRKENNNVIDLFNSKTICKFMINISEESYVSKLNYAFIN